MRRGNLFRKAAKNELGYITKPPSSSKSDPIIISPRWLLAFSPQQKLHQHTGSGKGYKSFVERKTKSKENAENMSSFSRHELGLEEKKNK